MGNDLYQVQDFVHPEYNSLREFAGFIYLLGLDHVGKPQNQFGLLLVPSIQEGSMFQQPNECVCVCIFKGTPPNRGVLFANPTRVPPPPKQEHS